MPEALTGGGRSDLRCPVRAGQRGPGELPQWLPGPAVGHPGRDDRAGDPQAAAGLLFPGLAAGTAPPVRAGADQRDRDQLPAGRLRAAGGELAETLGIQSLSKSQVSELSKSLDGAVEQFRSRPLDAGPYRFVQADAMTVRVREGGRTVLAHALGATGVNADGKRRSSAWRSPAPRTAPGGAASDDIRRCHGCTRPLPVLILTAAGGRAPPPELCLDEIEPGGRSTNERGAGSAG